MFILRTLQLTLAMLTVVNATTQRPENLGDRNEPLKALRDNTYDYVIVGAGLTGLVVANRLSENKNKTILVIESGIIDDSPGTKVPYLANMLNAERVHVIKSAPEPWLGGSRWDVLVGNVVGGGSVINGMTFDRGADIDYDIWEELGNPGWSWKEMEDYFKKSNRFTPPSELSQTFFNITYDSSVYGYGPIQASIPSFQYPDMQEIWKAWTAEDIPLPQEGFKQPVGAYWIPNSIQNLTATRSHARNAYYDPIAERHNLELLTSSSVTEIILDQESQLTATGVKFTSHRDNVTRQVFARNDVILAAGAIFTPHLLMVSGVGPREVLLEANISVKRDIPGVGSNFQDHAALYMSYNLSNLAFPNPATLGTNATFNASAAAQYERDRTGPYSLGLGNTAAFLALKHVTSRWNSISESLLAQANSTKYLPHRYAVCPTLLAGFQKQRDLLVRQFRTTNAAMCELPILASGQAPIVLQKPLSRGIITLNATNPYSAPVVQYNTLQNPIDRSILADLVRFNRRHWTRPELSFYSPLENLPGEQYETDDDIIDASIRAGIIQPSFAHPTGGAAMMSEDLGGVVSSDLKVFGIGGLRVVDASLVPMIPAANLQATMYAIAEKAADIIKSEWHA